MTTVAKSPAGSRADVERCVLAIWRAVLRTQDLDPTDDFFALGGTSITALSVISRVRKEFGTRVPLAVLFETPTISSLIDAVLALQIDDKGQEAMNAAVRPLVRSARDDDMDAVCMIVNHYIQTTPINFRTAPQQPDDWRADLATYVERYPWLVAELDGETVGVAYAVPWKAREAYGWCAETTVYVREGVHGQGVGRALYDPLMTCLDGQGYRTEVGVIALPNAASVALHEAVGFLHAGTLRSVGFKFDNWWDVGFWQRPARQNAPPDAIRPVAEVLPSVLDSIAMR
jgi:phosphinothricin acetyltransferase